MTSADKLCPITLDVTWIPQALLLSTEAGWNQNAADWSLFLSHGTVLGLSIDDRLVATAAALPYGDHFGWISMVLVSVAWRRQGLATRLVTACTSLLRDSGRAALLDASPAGTAIYAALGFVPLGTMERWEGNGGEECPATPASPNLTLDQLAFGADRRFLLQNFLSRPGSLAFHSTNGYAILRRGASACQLGPIVAPSSEAPALAAEAIRAASGRVVVDVLEAGTPVIPSLVEHGFRPQRSFTRMALGLATLPGNPAQMVAAAGPEFG
jgi:ribosomal protein S18 acetylase RimI-like enzyme